MLVIRLPKKIGNLPKKLMKFMVTKILFYALL
jgi:hypothetical protein